MSERQPLRQHPHEVQIELLEEHADEIREDLSHLMDGQYLAETKLARASEKVEKVRTQLQDILKIIDGLRA